MNVVVETPYLRRLQFACSFSPALVQTVYNHRRVVSESVGILLRVEPSPVHQYIYKRRLLTVFAVFWIVVVLLVRDILYHQVEHLQRCRRQFVLLFRLENLFQQIRVRHIEFSLLVGLDTLNLFEALQIIFIDEWFFLCHCL